MLTTCFDDNNLTICEVSKNDYITDYYCGRTLKRNPYALKAYGFLDLINSLILLIVSIYMLICKKKWWIPNKDERYEMLGNNYKNYNEEEDVVVGEVNPLIQSDNEE